MALVSSHDMFPVEQSHRISHSKFLFSCNSASVNEEKYFADLRLYLQGSRSMEEQPVDIVREPLSSIV